MRGLGLARLMGALLVSLFVAACPGGSSGGVTVPQTDSTPPTLTLGVGDLTVDVGGSPASTIVPAGTSSLNVLATAVDNESGIFEVGILVERTETTCVGGSCTSGAPLMSSTPEFRSTGTRASPGAQVAASSILADVLQLGAGTSAQVPAGGTLTIRVRVWATAENNLGGKSQTAVATLDWVRP